MDDAAVIWFYDLAIQKRYGIYQMVGGIRSVVGDGFGAQYFVVVYKVIIKIYGDHRACAAEPMRKLADDLSAAGAAVVAYAIGIPKIERYYFGPSGGIKRRNGKCSATCQQFVVSF